MGARAGSGREAMISGRKRDRRRRPRWQSLRHIRRARALQQAHRRTSRRGRSGAACRSICDDTGTSCCPPPCRHIVILRCRVRWTDIGARAIQQGAASIVSYRTGGLQPAELGEREDRRRGAMADTLREESASRDGARLDWAFSCLTQRDCKAQRGFFRGIWFKVLRIEKRCPESSGGEVASQQCQHSPWTSGRCSGLR
jgi:hypothetical protein